jgi:hypothetical protein
MEDGTKRSVEKLVSRRKAKGGGYECVPYPLCTAIPVRVVDIILFWIEFVDQRCI